MVYNLTGLQIGSVMNDKIDSVDTKIENKDGKQPWDAPELMFMPRRNTAAGKTRSNPAESGSTVFMGYPNYGPS